MDFEVKVMCQTTLGIKQYCPVNILKTICLTNIKTWFPGRRPLLILRSEVKFSPPEKI